MRKKALFFLPAGIGGAERMTITIAQFLDKSVYDVGFVIVTGRHPERMADTMSFIPQGHKVSVLNIRIIWYFATLRIARLLRREKPDVVFSSLQYLNIRVILAAKMVGGIRIIVRNANTIRFMPWYSRLLIRLSYPYADTVIAQQEEMAQELVNVVRLNSQKVKVLQNPIDTATIDEKIKVPSPYTCDERQTRYVCVARFSRTKGQDVLVRAFSKVREVNAKAHLYLVGKYEEQDAYYCGVRQFVIDNHLADCVHFVGFDSNPYRWVKHADCYVMPSRLEGLPNALIDAMYIGIPVVATTCIPVVERIVQDGYNGYLVPSEDVDAMAMAMQEALELKDFTMTYHSATKEDFCKLFG